VAVFDSRKPPRSLDALILTSFHRTSRNQRVEQISLAGSRRNDKKKKAGINLVTDTDGGSNSSD
jgi:hypothetical protein